MKKWLMGATLTATLAALAACGDDEAGGNNENGDIDELSMGFVPSQDAGEIEATVEPMEEHLEEHLDDISVEANVMTDYAALVEGMRTQSIDIGFLPPLGFVQAEERADVNVALKAERFGDDSYLAQFVVHEDSDIESLDDVLEAEPGELTWAYGDTTSTAGYLFPASHLIDEGLEDINEHFGHQTVGGHDNALQSLLDGQADLATTFDDARDNLADEHEDIYDTLEVIEYTEPIPNDTISYRSDLPEELTEELTDIFLGFNDDEEMIEIMEDVYNWTGVLEAESEDYDIVRDTYERFQDEIEE
ncbi:phosphate/phosphite/phosphonate ABC transporter substrate-binding protein [Salsuginibacillus halophilus]|uniref:phosphate/phosphite/phosphonate ABC transporter substrate-binding protein n=1 Tax=Salsuginibacillus halophilus TaxID=517424 RepID=UPI000D0D7B24|nr:phosphate/phosphite/phosphonate ABC transporter substrate-binding protein [Salsuginibacillus halophilus]